MTSGPIDDAGAGPVVATLAICTRDRPDELRALLDSIGASKFRRSGRPNLDVLVVVNGPNDRGYDADELSARCTWPVRVVYEPRAGVTYARNASIANRSREARWFLCVDDDETVTPSWLERHLVFAESSDADVITGPVLTIVPPGARPWVRSVWINVPRHETGAPQRSFLGGNVLFRSSLFDELDAWYDDAQALSTGDDYRFGVRLIAAGYRIVWNDAAIVWEAVHPQRLTTRWIVERYLSFGGGHAIALREDHGWRKGLVPELGPMARLLGQAVWSVVRWRDPRHRGRAIALTCRVAGFVGGAVGWRVRDYRHVTSASPRPPGRRL